MGNCLRIEKSTVWAGDDWGSVGPAKRHAGLNDGANSTFNMEKETLLGEKMGFSSSSPSSSSSSSSTREVKVKITKKQLEELVGRVDMKGLSVGQILAELMNTSDQYEMQRQHSWRPALQSIPEVN